MTVHVLYILTDINLGYRTILSVFAHHAYVHHKRNDLFHLSPILKLDVCGGIEKCVVIVTVLLYSFIASNKNTPQVIRA